MKRLHYLSLIHICGSHVHLIISPTSKATPEQPLVDDPDCMAQIPVDAVWSVYEQVLGKEL